MTPSLSARKEIHRRVEGIAIVAALSSVLLAGHVRAHGVARPDDHAPIGIMQDHVHHEGEVMFSYRYMRMRMDGNRDGTSSRSVGEVRAAGFPVIATDMDMEMHMFGAMYAPHDRVTLTAMLPYVRLAMDHVAGPDFSTAFTTRSRGIGDLKTVALVRLFEGERYRVHANAGVSWPTGSVSKEDNLPATMGVDVRLPYPMQIGSGTVDFMPGLTYGGHAGPWSWGAQALGTVRAGHNTHGYRKGNRYDLAGWFQRMWTPWLSTGISLGWSQWFDVVGDDDFLDPAMVPTADPDRRGGRRLDGGLGVNFLLGDGPLAGTRFAVEGRMPLYQYLDGPQLETDWIVTAGWQFSFRAYGGH